MSIETIYKNMKINSLIRKIIKEETEEWIDVSPEEYNELLDYVNGDGSVIKRLPDYKGKKIKITGDLNLSRRDDVENIDSIDYVDGILNISGTDISYFDKSKVKKYMIYADSKMHNIERQKIYNQRMEYQQELREEDVWNVENDDEESNETEAIYDYLLEHKIPEVIEDETTGEEVREDKYFLFKTDYDYHGGNIYIWLGNGSHGSEYVVFRDDEIKDAAKKELQERIDENGLDTFRWYVWENNFDEEYTRRWLYNDYEEDIRQDPEGWSIEKELTDDQKRYIEIYNQNIESLRKKLEDQSLTDEQKDEIENDIYDFEQLIEDINENPEGDYSEESIEEQIESMVDDNIDDFLKNKKNQGYDNDFLMDFIDVDGAIEDVIQSDGYGNVLNRYDNSDDEYKINGTWYHVMRHD